MRVAILANPSSGRGRALRVARDLREAIGFAGHEVEEHSAREPSSTDAVKRAEVVVIVGGDGTVHHQLPALARSDAAIWHAPLGTENLFAREFGMTTDADALLRAIGAAKVVSIDGATINGRWFAIMAGVGPDSSIVARVAAVRTGPIRKLSYLGPSIAEFRRPNLPVMSIDVDGRRVVDARRGFVVVANSRQYGGRINPARGALMDDGLLDVVFFPCSSRVRALSWTVGCRVGRQGASRWLVSEHATSAVVTIDESQGAKLQLDGEFAGHASGELDIRVQPAALKVLLPVGSALRKAPAGVPNQAPVS